jgi:hypothetical protein
MVHAQGIEPCRRLLVRQVLAVELDVVGAGDGNRTRVETD